jgi:hypothetical protein
VVVVVGVEAQVEVKNSFGQSPKGGIPPEPIPEFDLPFVFTKLVKGKILKKKQKGG